MRRPLPALAAAVLGLAALAALAACGEPPRNEAAGDEPAGNDESPVVAEIGPVPNAGADREAAAPPPPPAGDAVAATLDRLGPLRIGATLAQLGREGVAVAGRDEPMEGSTCAYATFQRLPDVSAMLDGERIVRIDVSGAGHAATGGLRVGQSEADAIRRLGRVDVRPHPYTGPQGHYLIHHEDGAPRGLIAETDGKKVVTFRFGQWEQVQWIEGCS